LAILARNKSAIWISQYFKNNRIVFNLGENKYRLVVKINFPEQISLCLAIAWKSIIN